MTQVLRITLIDISRLTIRHQQHQALAGILFQQMGA